MSAPLLIDGRVVGNADINRRVVIRAYAPCLAWKTIFQAGDNSCRLVRLSLFSFPFLSSVPSILVALDVTSSWLISVFLASTLLSLRLCPRSFSVSFLPTAMVTGLRPLCFPAGPWNLRSVSHRQSRHARTDGPSYTSHVCSSSRRVAHVHVYHRLNWSWPVRAVARARLINVLQSRISGSRTRAIYTGLTTGLPWGKIISMFR